VERDPNKAPADYADEYDPTGYYERKRIHREEMLLPLAIVYGLAIVAVTVAVIWRLIA